MQTMRIANVLLEDSPRLVSYPSLYCRSTSPVFFDQGENAWRLHGSGSFDFTTYFNSVSIAKWRRYTNIGTLFLHLEIKGASCSLTPTHADAFSRDASQRSELAVEKPADDAWHAFDLEIPSDDTDVLVGFLIESEGSVLFREGYYYTEIEESILNEIELSLATTTFKKESYILANIGLLKKEIIDSDEPISEHIRVHVIDNGSTLDAAALSDERVTVHPNNNVGGSGGFAYGMIVSLEQDVPATHVLLMDDDVAVSPESIKRTYTLLQLLKKEYHDSFISGAMLNYEIDEDFWEDTGFMSKEGRFSPVKPPARVTLLQDLVCSEAFQPAEEWVDQMYAAWWYCCIPASIIRREGLPLPFFVRCDDAEYGIRCKPNFITMNGICIWHLSFHARYSAAVERYQTTRNTLISQATTGMAPKSDFLRELHNNIQLELKKFNYDDAELLLDGFEDFMKGPDFIAEPGKVEECFLRSIKKAEKLYSFAELQKQLDEIEGVDLDLSALTVDEINRDFPRTRWQAFVDFVTFNGQRTPFAGNAQGVAVIPSAGWIFPPGKIRKKNVIVVIDRYNRKGAVRYRDRARFRSILNRYNKDLVYYKVHRGAIERQYRAARERLTSFEFWKEYLGKR